MSMQRKKTHFQPTAAQLATALEMDPAIMIELRLSSCRRWLSLMAAAARDTHALFRLDSDAEADRIDQVFRARQVVQLLREAGNGTRLITMDGHGRMVYMILNELQRAGGNVDLDVRMDVVDIVEEVDDWHRCVCCCGVRSQRLRAAASRGLASAASCRPHACPHRVPLRCPPPPPPSATAHRGCGLRLPDTSCPRVSLAGTGTCFTSTSRPRMWCTSTFARYQCGLGCRQQRIQ